MPSISYDAFAAWSNYHLTIGAPPHGELFPKVTIQSMARFHASDLETSSGLGRFAATGKELCKHLEKVRKMSLQGPPQIGIAGRGWSFSPLIGSSYSQLQCDGLSGLGTLGPEERHRECKVGADAICLASGGTRLREIVNWAGARSKSIMTSGTHLGMSLAGGFGTSSHGSRLGYGGLQNMILGMHLIVGPGAHVWIERKSNPVLSDAGVAALGIPDTELRVIRDDGKFEDALVHLGAMGIVNGAALELVHDQVYALMMREETIDLDWLKLADKGRFNDIARRLNAEVTPAFYELTVDPHDLFGDPAGHILYFASGSAPSLAQSPIVRPLDAISTTGDLRSPVRTKSVAGDCPDLGSDGVSALDIFFCRQKSAFAYYKRLANFAPNRDRYAPDDPDARRGRWADLHGDEITADMPGALYNASFAIPMDKVSTAMPLISSAVADLPKTFVYTIRFVQCAAGTLAFTRFPKSAVIEIDGVSPLVCRLFAAQASFRPDLQQEFLALQNAVETGARRVRLQLDKHKIPYSMHWAKLGDLDRAKVRADFGDPAVKGTPAWRWRRTRHELLGSDGEALFWNAALKTYGLV